MTYWNRDGRLRLSFTLVLLLMLGCGGGGSSSSAAGGQTPPPAAVVDVSAIVASDPGSALPADWQTGTFIEIYVRGYKDSDGDGIGDLKGLTQSLDYLKDLGVTGIWLMPVTASQDHDHGYAVSDYRNIEAQYGTLADFDELVRQAHMRGIGVIIDYVMNHSGSNNPLFTHAKAAATDSYRDWYIWQTAKPSGWNIYGNDPWRRTGTGYYFGAFSDQMPDFNLRNAAVIDYHRNSMRFWLNRGVDGFRFDAVGNLVENGPGAWEDQPENYVIMGNVRALLDGYAQRYMVCEGPADPIGFAATTACRSAFAFGHNNDIVNAAKGNAAAILAVADYFRTAPTTIATMVSNHDAFAGDRLYDQVGGNLAQYRLAAATYLLQPGTPFIYYGEEIGMSGNAALGGDWKLRTPMSWSANSITGGFTTGTPFRALSGNVASNNVAAEQRDPTSLFGFYKALLALRKTLPSLASGSYLNPTVSGSTLSFQRMLGNELTVVVINYGNSAATAVVDGLPANAVLTDAYGAGTGTPTASAIGSATFTVPAQSCVVYWTRS